VKKDEKKPELKVVAKNETKDTKTEIIPAKSKPKPKPPAP